MMISSNQYEILGDRIILFKNIVVGSELLMEMSDESEWRVNPVNRHSNGDPYRFESTIYVQRADDRGNQVISGFNDALVSYGELIGSSIPKEKHTLGNTWEAHVSRYIVGGYVGPHADEDIIEDNGEYSAIIYINDEYDGGEVAFVDHDVKIKPSAGDVVVFPCYYKHYALEVTSGQKYISILRVKY